MALPISSLAKTQSKVTHTFVFSDVHTDYTAGILIEFARRIAMRGHRVLFLHPRPTVSRTLIDRFQSFGAETYLAPGLSGRSPWRVARDMETVIAAANATDPILVACESVPMRGQALLGARRGWRTVFHTLGLRSGINLRTYLRERTDSYLLKRSGGVVLGCSRGVCENMTERMEIDPEKVAYFPNWIDPARFVPGRPDPTTASEGHLTGAVPTVCCVAGFSPIKQQDLLIRALSRLRSAGLELRVLMVGGADRFAPEMYLRECQDLAARLGLADSIRFLGSREDVPELLRQSDAFVLPSRREGLACALLEAMSTSLPCVAAAIHASYEVIVPGKNGFLFSPGSELDLAATIQHVFSLPRVEREQIGEAARRTVSERYTWEAAFRGVAPFLERFGIHV